jgi:hypothetical protein
MPFLLSNGQAPLHHLTSFHRYVINIVKGSDCIVWFFDGSNGAQSFRKDGSFITGNDIEPV